MKLTALRKIHHEFPLTRAAGRRLPMLLTKVAVVTEMSLEFSAQSLPPAKLHAVLRTGIRSFATLQRVD
jgi:hypothetical protein